MRFDEWNRKEHSLGQKSAEISKIDEWFVKMCRLVKRASDDAGKKNQEYQYGRMAADSFDISDNGRWTFIEGKSGMDYCPPDETPSLSTDLFAMGLILYERIIGETYSDKLGMPIGIPFIYDEACEKAKKEGRTSLLDKTSVPEKYEQLGYILQELTQFNPKDRMKSFDEFPYAECKIEYLDEETGKAVKEASCEIVERINKSWTVPSVIKKEDKTYRLKKGNQEFIDYSFLKKTYQLKYQAVK